VGDLEHKDFEILDSPDATIVAVVPPVIEKVETPAEGAEVKTPAEGEAPAEPEVISKGKKEEEEEK